MNACIEIIYPALEELNETRDEDLQLAKSPETVLFGNGALLDSIGLVNLIVTAERIAHEVTGKSITLASEDAFSRRQSPFRTVRSLGEFIEELLAKEV